MTRVEISPSILAGDFLDLGQSISQAEEGGANRLQIDVMDGIFVPNISVGQPIVRAIRTATGMVLEAHLMILDPDRYVPDFADAGADVIIVHAEASTHLYRTLQEIHSCGKACGVALNPATPALAIQEVMHLADLILVMTVNPGFGGQEFIFAMLPKIAAIRRELDRRNLPARLEVDGGINLQTAPQAVHAGARILVAGTAVYDAPEGAAAAITNLRKVSEAASQIPN